MHADGKDTDGKRQGKEDGGKGQVRKMEVYQSGDLGSVAEHWQEDQGKDKELT
jgi:hypothetical protein